MNPAETLCGTIIGFTCATRCKALTAEAMKSHDASGKILAIHSVVVEERFRNSGVASAMLADYISAMERLNNKSNLRVKMEKFVLMAKKNLLAFYVRNGFMAIGISPVVHGKDQWFELERKFVTSEDTPTYECYLIDSFADEAKQGSGNPAGVVVLDSPPSSSESDNSDEEDDQMDVSETDRGDNERGMQWMATVAKEFNQSETAFIWPLTNHNTIESNGSTQKPQKNNNIQSTTAVYAVRYYTRSGVEVDLCGHATLAAAYSILHPKKLEDPKQNYKINFIAKNDNLQAELLVPLAISQPNKGLSVSQKASRIALTFPKKSVTPMQEEGGQSDVLNMMALAFSGVSENAQSFFSQHILHIGTTDEREDLFIELSEEGFDLLHGVKVDYEALTTWDEYTRGVIICCAASPSKGKIEKKQQNQQSKQLSVSFRSRFFGPKVGIDEDAVTGSAHCSLAPHFGTKLGKNVVVGRQESERGGVVECILKQEEGRVCIVGTAVKTVAGRLSISI